MFWDIIYSVLVFWLPKNSLEYKLVISNIVFFLEDGLYCSEVTFDIEYSIG